ncbi:MAG: redoxin domain-containing protein [Bacteroidales bacterium]|nr:redoxin domain-containing protein [Bacteroidales bacterium]
MKKTLVILSILISVIGCKQKPESFEYIITGKVMGKDSGEICFFESSRVGDEVVIPFERGTFEYEGKTSEILSTSIAFHEDVKSGGWRSFPLIIEPGVIEIQLDRDSIHEKSRTLKGDINLRIQDVNKITGKYWDVVFNKTHTRDEINKLLKDVYSDSIALLIEQNADNFTGIYLLNSYRNWDMFNDKQLANLFEKIQKPDLRRSLYFKKLHSNYLARINELNKIGTKAINFSLSDSTGKILDFHNIAKDRMVFVELSGSWCGNQTRETHELDPIYEKYREKGFEIVTVVFESKYDRWKKWVKKEKFPWVNLIELEYGNKNDVFFSQQIFTEGDYLVDEKGIVVANNLSSARLNEKLMEKFEPEKYREYIENKWKLPEGTYILDREKPINTFEVLTSGFSGKAFFIDCWATWCSPCIEEFQYNEPLKKFLKQYGIEKVYISFDRNLDDAKWLSFIKKHNLSGYHMRINEEFVSDFAQVSDWTHQLPTYIIVNKTGEIVEKSALRPGDKDKLYEQIKSRLKL